MRKDEVGNTSADSTAYIMFEHVVQRFEPQSKLLRTWELKGGVSAQVTAIEIERPDGCTQKMIVRQHGEVDSKHNPHIAADEFKLLQLLHSVGLAVPEPYYLDQSGEIFPTPYVVIEYIEGETIFGTHAIADFIPQLAMQLQRIHEDDRSNLDVSFLPRHAEKVAEKIGERPAKLMVEFKRGVFGICWKRFGLYPSRIGLCCYMEIFGQVIFYGGMGRLWA